MKTIHKSKNIHMLPLLILMVLFGGVLFYLVLQLKPTVETQKTEVKDIPNGINRRIETASSSATFRVPILFYHYVEYVRDKRDTIRQSLNIPPHVFDQQMKTLREAGYTFLTASDLADILDGKKHPPSLPILITFDDGHWDLYTDVLPILKKYHVKATAYIISGFLGGSDFLTKNQLGYVIQSGLVEIGAHTVHHIALGRKLLPIVQFEVTQSKTMLENLYNFQVVSFAYPSGSFDQQAADVVKHAGFRSAVTTIPGIEQRQSNRFYLYRLRPGYRTGNVLLRYLRQESFKKW